MFRNWEAVSESIGYLIIFGLVLTGIGLITLYGYPLLIQQQSSANLRNMEQTMIVLQNDIKSLTYKLSNYKETTMRVSGGSLSLYGPPYTEQTFRVEWNDGMGSPDQPLFRPSLGGGGQKGLGELRYLAVNDNIVIALENGAVIEKPLAASGSFMLADPRWFLDNTSGVRTLSLSFMNLSSAETSGQLLSQEGVGAVRMRLGRANLTTVYWPSDNQVNITYTPANTGAIPPDGYALAWRTYLTTPTNFEGSMKWSGSGNPGDPDEYSIKNIRNVVIKEYDIVIETL